MSLMFFSELILSGLKTAGLRCKIIQMFWQLMVYDSSAVNQIWSNQIYTVDEVDYQRINHLSSEQL